MKRILLLNPPSGLFRRDDRCQSRVEDQTVRIVFPPIDLALAAAIARRAGLEARIADYPALGATWEHLSADLRDFRPDVLLVNLTTATARADLDAIREARRANPAVLTIARGEIFERQGGQLFAECPELDLALFGETEETLGKLLAGADPALLPSVVYRRDNEVIINPELARVAGLDTLPLPARDLLDNSLYRSPETGNPLTVILANRGCPSKCIFCPAGPVSGYHLRLRSPQSILEELRECVEKYGIREFLFNGDTFTMNKRWLLELCGLINGAGLDIHWGCNSRVDTMDAERADALKKAGCWVVAFGIESGDQGMLDHMKKGTRVEDATKAVRACKAAGLAVHTFFIIGLPWETRATLDKTYRFIKTLDPDFFDINIAFPLPGTELHDIATAEGLITAPDGEGSYAQSAVRSRELSAETLTAWRKNALLRLYARPRYIARILRRAIRTGTLTHYLRAAAFRLKSLIKI